MNSPLVVIEVDLLDEEAVIITFNDGTFASFTPEELASLHPVRSLCEGESAEA